MNNEEQVGKNFAWGALSQVITRIFGLGFFVFMSHILLEKGMGQYNFIVSFVSFAFLISDFGIGNYLYREWSMGNTTLEQVKTDFNINLTVKLIVSAVVFVPFCIINWFINRDIFLPLTLYFFFVVLSSVISQMEVYLASANNFKFAAFRLLLERLVIIILGIIFLLILPNVISVFVAMIISQIAALAYYFFGRFPFKFGFSINWPRTKELVVLGLPFVLFTILVSIYGRIDMAMLKFMKGFETVGWYGAGYKAYELANIFPAVLFLPAIFPILSRVFYLESREKYREFFNRSLRVLFTSSIIISMLFIVFAPYIVSAFFPDSFGPSTLVMRIIVLVLTISSLSVIFNSLIVIQKKEKLSLKIVLVSCLVNVVLNTILIPRYSLYGAAWATVIAELVNLLLLQHYADWDKDKKLLIKMVSVIVVTAGAFLTLKYTGYLNYVPAGVALIIGIGFLIVLLGVIQKSDLQMFYLPFKNKFQSIINKQN